MDMEDITPEWISKAVASFGRHTLAPCVQVSVVPIPNDRVQVHRLALRFAAGAGDRPASLILKTPIAPPLPGGSPSPHDAGSREAYFFRRLAQSSGVWTARCYAVEFDPASGASVLLLEDLLTLKLRQGDRGQGVRKTEAEHVLRTLATFHARHWDRPHDVAQREVLALTDSVTTASDGAIQAYYRQAWPAVEACGLYDIPPDVAQFGRTLMNDPNWARHQLAARPLTIVHGDLHVENMFFADSTGTADFALIDWEDLALANGLVDVAWLVSTSLNIRDVDWEPDLLRGYFEGLINAGVRGYSWDDCQADYRLAVETVFVQGVLNCTVDTLPSAEENAREREFGQRYLLACQRNRPWALRGLAP